MIRCCKSFVHRCHHHHVARRSSCYTHIQGLARQLKLKGMQDLNQNYWRCDNASLGSLHQSIFPNHQKIHLANVTMHQNCIQHKTWTNKFVCTNSTSQPPPQKKNNQHPTSQHHDLCVDLFRPWGHWRRLFGSQIHGRNETLHGTRGVTCLSLWQLDVEYFCKVVD